MGCVSSHSAAGRTALGEVVDRATHRMGRIPVEGRYHTLPRRLEDDYDLEKTQLGMGYNGSVELATSKHTGVQYAVKNFKLRGAGCSKREELLSEVEVYLSMDHPHVARLMEVYESERDVSLVMECCGGGELYERIREQKVFSEKEAARATRQMLLAVNYIHKEGVVHRDLKLENFLYDSPGSDFLKLIDFGFSKFYTDDTTMEESLGTISYVAPEVLGKSYSSGSCDLWSLGVIVFVLLAGYMPFSGQSDRDVMREIRSGKYVMRDSRWQHVSVSGRAFVQRLLVVNPTWRMTAEQALSHPWIVQLGNPPAPDLAAIGSPCIADAFLAFATAPRFQQASMQMMAWSLSLDERRNLRDLFLHMDTTHSGVIKLAELSKALRDTYRMAAEDHALVVQTLQAMDVDGDGDLHYSDFLAVMMASRIQDRETLLRETFRHFDTENRSHITPRGLKQFFQEEVPAEEVDSWFLEADTDGDGRISVEEFVAYMDHARKAPLRAMVTEEVATKTSDAKHRAWKRLFFPHRHHLRGLHAYRAEALTAGGA